MIYGKNEVSGRTALDFIEDSVVIFYQTGSRYFGNPRPDSDYDFFTQFTPEIENHLVTGGFTCDYESYEGDPLFVKVYTRDNVHVQVTHDARAKKWIQYCLAPVFRSLKLSKEEQRMLWSTATKLYNSGMEEQAARLRLMPKLAK